MELGLRPRVVWFVETCGHAEASGQETRQRGGPASQKLGAAGTGNLKQMLSSRLRLSRQSVINFRFPMLRTQLEASCATRETTEGLPDRVEPATSRGLVRGDLRSRGCGGGRRLTQGAKNRIVLLPQSGTPRPFVSAPATRHRGEFVSSRRVN